MVLTKINQKKSIKILASIIVLIVLSTIASQSEFTAYGASSDAGFQDGVSDCRSGTSDALNGHSNAGHHSAAYMDAYNQGLASCNSSDGSSSSANSGGSSSSASTASSDWTLTVNLRQTQFGTSSAHVEVQGPFGYKDSQNTATGPSPSVSFTIPGNAIPDNYKFHVCISSSIISALIPNCPDFTHASGDQTVSANIPG